MTGKLVWTTHLPISFPSNPQRIRPDGYLIADYARPGQILEFNRPATSCTAITQRRGQEC